MLTPPAALEALLFAAGEPLPKKRLAGLLGIDEGELSETVRALREQVHTRGLALVESEDALELRTGPEAADIVKKLREAELTRDLGRAGLEALAIILYRGGATRSEIDWIRGVNSAQTVRSLMLRGLIERTEDEKDRRRFRYLATTDALAHLGVTGAEELPRYAELSGATEKAVKESEESHALETHAA